VPALQRRARFIVLIAIALMVLLIIPTFNEYSNIPKYSILFIASAIGAAVLGVPKFGFLERKNWKSWAPPIVFLTIMLILTLITDHKHTAFFGTYGSGNGWLHYLGFTTLFLLTAFSFNFVTVTKLFHMLIILGIIVGLYGFLQFKGIDFIIYTESSLPVTATFGNSNFASAFIGLAGIALVWRISETKNLSLKILLLAILLGLLYVIYVSQSVQGFYIFFVGLLLYIGIIIFAFNKKVGLLYSLFCGTGFMLVFLGLLQIGPLKGFVFQISNLSRVDYYRTSWRMFVSHPFTGVGIDRFGDYYRSYRDIDAAFRFSPRSVANHAHSASFQFLATGGILLFLAYLVLLVFVIVAAVQGIKKFKDNDKILFGVLVSIWLASQFHAQISAAQITLTAINWVLSGAIISLGFNSELISSKDFPPNIYADRRGGAFANSKLFAGGLASILFVTSFVWLVPIWRAEYNIKLSRTLQGNSENLNFITERNRLILKSVLSVPGEVKYKIFAADILIASGEAQLARQQLFDALKLDPRSYDANVYMALAYERDGLIHDAIKSRFVAAKMDPNDTSNWLQLGKNLARVGDYQAVNNLIELVAPLAGKSTIARDLNALLPAVPT
jgi:O-antigen ligase